MKQNNHFYLFDFHSRGKRGLSIVRGSSVLLKISDLREVQKYIQVFLSRLQGFGRVIFSVSVNAC